MEENHHINERERECKKDQRKNEKNGSWRPPNSDEHFSASVGRGFPPTEASYIDSLLWVPAGGPTLT